MITSAVSFQISGLGGCSSVPPGARSRRWARGRWWRHHVWDAVGEQTEPEIDKVQPRRRMSGVWPFGPICPAPHAWHNGEHV